MKQTDLVHRFCLYPEFDPSSTLLCSYQAKLSACKVSKGLGNLNIYNLSICSQLPSISRVAPFQSIFFINNPTTKNNNVLVTWIFFFEINKYDAPLVRRTFLVAFHKKWVVCGHFTRVVCVRAHARITIWINKHHASGQRYVGVERPKKVCRDEK